MRPTNAIQREEFRDRLSRDLFVDSCRKAVIQVHGVLLREFEAAGIGLDDDQPLILLYNCGEPSLRRFALDIYGGQAEGRLERFESDVIGGGVPLGVSAAIAHAVSFKYFRRLFVELGFDAASAGLPPAEAAVAPGFIGVLAFVHGKCGYTDVWPH